MQSGYGEMQQFIMDNCPPSLFSSMSPSQPNTSNNATPNPNNKFHPPPHFAHFGHPIPTTQQFFHHHDHFQLFQHQQHMGLEHESEPDNPNSPAGPASFLAAMNFKLGVNESSGGSRDDDGILRGGADDGGSHDDSRLPHHHHHHNHHSWHGDGDSNQATNIKQPFWRPLDIDYINPNNKRPSKEKQPVDINSNVKHFKKDIDQDGNYKLFSELEAIYKPGGTPNISSGGGVEGVVNCNNQTGSGSALTGEERTLLPSSAAEPYIEEQHDTISDTSNNDEVLPTQPPEAENTIQKGSGNSSAGRRKSRMKRRQQKELASIALFFESLVKRFMDHQENLHHKFLEVMERKDQERIKREETWRKQEAARANIEAAARAQERALAAARESAIISFLEKITGESLHLPTKIQMQNQNVEGSHNVNHDQQIVELEQISSGVQLSSSRWPKTEVQALIRVRSGFETRFQEPGLKGLLWEEVSLAMGALGYQRNAKRCKEKWENINKYFRKAKDSGKKRPHHSKTCPYFQQLDQLYSNSKSNNANLNEERKDNSELLDAIVVYNDGGLRRNVEFNGNSNELVNNEDGDLEDDGGGGDGEGQGESQEQAQNLENLSTPLHGNAVHV